MTVVIYCGDYYVIDELGYYRQAERDEEGLYWATPSGHLERLTADEVESARRVRRIPLARVLPPALCADCEDRHREGRPAAGARHSIRIVDTVTQRVVSDRLCDACLEYRLPYYHARMHVID